MRLLGLGLGWLGGDGDSSCDYSIHQHPVFVSPLGFRHPSTGMSSLLTFRVWPRMEIVSGGKETQSPETIGTRSRLKWYVSGRRGIELANRTQMKLAYHPGCDSLADYYHLPTETHTVLIFQAQP
jgi:hypothetical protein